MSKSFERKEGWTKYSPGLATVNHIILSHPHRDHVELLSDLLWRYTVEHVWDSGRLHDI